MAKATLLTHRVIPGGQFAVPHSSVDGGHVLSALERVRLDAVSGF
jgi:hypothetical protein